MSDELAYRMDVLRLFSDVLKRIQADPQTPAAIRQTIGEVVAWEKDVFPFVVDPRRPDHIARLRELAEIFSKVLGRIHDDPQTPCATQVLITHTFVRFGNRARRRPSPHYERAKGEVAATSVIPPPRRPQLRIYEPGRDQPRDVLVFRR